MSIRWWLSRKRWIVAATVTFACGGSASPPTGPTSDPPANIPSISAATVVTLRSGETDQPVGDATISLSGQSQTGMFSTVYTTDAAGQFTLDRTVVLSSPPLLEAAAPGGFLVRTTILRSDETTMSMWPASSPTGLDEVFSSTIVYSVSACPAVNTGQALLRKVSSSTATVQVAFDSTVQDAAAEAAHKQAIDRLNATLGGFPQYQFIAMIRYASRTSGEKT